MGRGAWRPRSTGLQRVGRDGRTRSAACPGVLRRCLYLCSWVRVTSGLSSPGCSLAAGIEFLHKRGGDTASVFLSFRSFV